MFKPIIKYTYSLKQNERTKLFGIKRYKLVADKVVKTQTIYKNKTKTDAEDLLFKLERGIK
jgi:hypothetical protein